MLIKYQSIKDNIRVKRIKISVAFKGEVFLLWAIQSKIKLENRTLPKVNQFKSN